MVDPAYPSDPRPASGAMPPPDATRPDSSRPAAVASKAAVTSATAALGADHWPAQATDAIVKVVDGVRDKTTGPITKVARIVVFGAFAAVVGLVALVMFSVLLVRLMNNYLFDHNVWAAHLVLGVLFTLVAAVLWSKAVAAPARD